MAKRKRRRKWWKSLLSTNYEAIADVFAYSDHALYNIADEDVADDGLDILILHPCGKREPTPTTHAAWLFWLEIEGERYARSESFPVVLLDIEKHNQLCRNCMPSD